MIPDQFFLVSFMNCLSFSCVDLWASVVDCPGLEYLDSLVNNEELRKHQKFATTDEDAAYIVVHFSPKEVMEHPLWVF